MSLKSLNPPSCFSLPLSTWWRTDDGIFDEEKRDFHKDFIIRAEMSVLFDVVLAANYLNIKGLLDLVCQEIADRMQNKSVRWVRKIFGIDNEFTLEEEEHIKNEHALAWKGVESDDKN
ncbi:SKP1-like protein 1B [Sesamum alatum]|uniref:SKP1-like protein 1B n=1 Tax=Sesamum alatum TaxID=300844 RepID=A0AAE2CN93_9LAMI|nr:SKP1-like protein 1B [Sesamum alatum]